jgi:hypothetical protein
MVVQRIALVKIQEIEAVWHALAHVTPAQTLSPYVGKYVGQAAYTLKKNHCVWPSVNMSLRRVQSYSCSPTRMALLRLPLSNRACLKIRAARAIAVKWCTKQKAMRQDKRRSKD